MDKTGTQYKERWTTFSANKMMNTLSAGKEFVHLDESSNDQTPPADADKLRPFCSDRAVTPTSREGDLDYQELSLYLPSFLLDHGDSDAGWPMGYRIAPPNLDVPVEPRSLPSGVRTVPFVKKPIASDTSGRKPEFRPPNPRVKAHGEEPELSRFGDNRPEPMRDVADECYQGCKAKGLYTGLPAFAAPRQDIGGIGREEEQSEKFPVVMKRVPKDVD